MLEYNLFERTLYVKTSHNKNNLFQCSPTLPILCTPPSLIHTHSPPPLCEPPWGEAHPEDTTEDMTGRPPPPPPKPHITLPQLQGKTWRNMLPPHTHPPPNSNNASVVGVLPRGQGGVGTSDVVPPVSSGQPLHSTPPGGGNKKLVRSHRISQSLDYDR